MYAVTSIWLVSLTRATLRRAEFGFLGVVVYTRVQTPRRWGLPVSAGVVVLAALSWRPFRTSCWIVGTASPSSFSSRRVARVLVGPAPCGAGCGRATHTALPSHGHRRCL